MLQQYLQYNDPLTIIWRKGTDDDPYVDRMDSLPVINNQITLLEIPSLTYRVKIEGYTEIDVDTYNRNRKQLNPNEFIVNYQNGNIQFNPSVEGKALLCTYKGRGLIMYPASRIYAMVSRSPDIVKTLQEIIEESLQRLSDTQQAINNLNVVIENAVEATNRANTATDNANLAKEQTLQAIDGATSATQSALDAAASTVMIYKDPVPTYDDIFLTYPEPENGWRIMVQETGDIYRFEGIEEFEWKLIDNWTGGSIPFASDTASGLLHKDDYKNFTIRSVVFVMPSIFRSGIQDYLIQFPFDGEVVDVTSYCTKTGILAPIEIAVEKISSEDFDQGDSWESMFSSNIFINTGMYKGTEPTIIDSHINKGDYFRINIVQLDNNFKGLSVQLNIKTKI